MAPRTVTSALLALTAILSTIGVALTIIALARNHRIGVNNNKGILASAALLTIGLLGLAITSIMALMRVMRERKSAMYESDAVGYGNTAGGTAGAGVGTGVGTGYGNNGVATGPAGTGTGHRNPHNMLGRLLGFFTLWVLATTISTLALSLARALIRTTVGPGVGGGGAGGGGFGGIYKPYWSRWYWRVASIYPFAPFLTGALATIALLTAFRHHQARNIQPMAGAHHDPAGGRYTKGTRADNATDTTGNHTLTA